ncbi:MAG: hypothetical protein R2838_22800 [Caldilineaceae bacterium]
MAGLLLHYDFVELGAATNFGKLYLMSNAPTNKWPTTWSTPSCLRRPSPAHLPPG